MNALKFSIIVPAYNEERDVGRTLSKLEEIDYPNYEVLVVDDGSQDRTAAIVESFVHRLPQFRLFRQPVNKGVSSARNRGIQEATGKVLVFLNADVLLPSDFLGKIKAFYEQGKQWVAALNKICNLENVYSRYMAAFEHYCFFVLKYHWVWTEAFSCTKEAAVSVGMFPEKMPGCYGEDGFFGLSLERRFDGVKATEITVPHVAPDNLESFWGQQKSRGKGRTNHYYYVRNYSFLKLLTDSIASTVWRVTGLIFQVPAVRAWRYSRLSPLKGRDFLPFVWAEYVKEIAMLLGMWSAFFKILKTRT